MLFRISSIHSVTIFEDDVNASIVSQQVIDRVNSKLNLRVSFLTNLSNAVQNSCNYYGSTNSFHNESSTVYFNRLYNAGNSNIPSNLPDD